MEFELVYFDDAVRYANHYATVSRSVGFQEFNMA